MARVLGTLPAPQPASSGRVLGTVPTAAPQTTPTLDASTKANQATFPATGNESPLGIAAKTVGNLPSSGINFAKGALDFLNPLNTVKTAQQIGTTIGEALNEGQSGKQLAIDTLKGLPQAAYKTIVPQFIQHVVSGDYGKAAATLENDPIGQIAPLIFVARAAASKAGVAPQFDQAISTIASPVTKTASAVGGGIANAAVGATKFATSQLTGLSPRTLEQVVANPQEFSQKAQSTITRPSLANTIDSAIQAKQSALSDTGSTYSGIRTLTEPIQVAPNYLDTLIKDTTGLNIKDGKLSTSGSASIRLPADVNALQTKLYNVWAPEFAKGYLTPEQFLNFRDDLSKLAYNDNGIGKSTTLSNLSSIIRGKANTDLRPQIPGLESIDKTYAPQVTELKQLSAGLIDKQGNLTDAAINKIANATGKGKDPLLNRLETLVPGITDHIKILKAVEDIQNSRENKPGTYLRAGALGAGLVTLNPYLIVSAVMSLPEVAVPLLRGLGYSNELISKTLNTLGIKGLPSAINQLPNTGMAPLNKQAEKMGVSAGLSIKDVSKIPPELQPLAQEAMKYKSAEEFVKAQPTAFHGTSADTKITKWSTKKALGRIWFTDSKDALTNTENPVAASGKGKIYQVYFDKNAKWATPEMADKSYTDQLIAEGYDGVYHPDSSGRYGNFYEVFNPNVIKTKSQLTDFYNSVKGTTKPAVAGIPKELQPLAQEALKYPTAEEFANNVGAIRDNYDWSYLDEMKARKAAGESYSHSDFNALSKLEATKRGMESRTFYRAGKVALDEQGNMWLTPQEAGASQYGGAGGISYKEYKVATQNPLVLQDVKALEKVLGKKLDSESNFTNSPTLKQQVIDYAKKNGYDSVLMPDSFPDGASGMESLVVWNKDLVKTKSQLTDFYNKVRGIKTTNK